MTKRDDLASFLTCVIQNNYLLDNFLVDSNYKKFVIMVEHLQTTDVVNVEFEVE